MRIASKQTIILNDKQQTKLEEKKTIETKQNQNWKKILEIYSICQLVDVVIIVVSSLFISLSFVLLPPKIDFFIDDIFLYTYRIYCAIYF